MRHYLIERRYVVPAEHFLEFGRIALVARTGHDFGPRYQADVRDFISLELPCGPMIAIQCINDDVRVDQSVHRVVVPLR